MSLFQGKLRLNGQMVGKFRSFKFPPWTGCMNGPSGGSVSAKCRPLPKLQNFATKFGTRTVHKILRFQATWMWVTLMWTQESPLLRTKVFLAQGGNQRPSLSSPSHGNGNSCWQKANTRPTHIYFLNVRQDNKLCCNKAQWKKQNLRIWKMPPTKKVFLYFYIFSYWLMTLNLCVLFRFCHVWNVLFLWHTLIHRS